jgi:uncharacterized RDD family membrane protein YckC
VERLDTTATVDTPERVRFRYRLAGPGQRAAAWCADALVQGLIAGIVGAVLALFASIPVVGGVGNGVLLLAMFALQWLYGVFFETVLSGRTPGKVLLELRVVRTDGSPARFPDLLLRNLLRTADFLPLFFGLGVLVMAADKRMRRLGDLVGGTVVVAEDKTSVLGAVRIDPPVTDEERRALPARIELRPDELEVLEALLRRRPQLTRELAEELAKWFAPELAKRTGLVAASNERILSLAYARATGKDRP